MLLSLRKNGLTSLFKEVRVFIMYNTMIQLSVMIDRKQGRGNTVSLILCPQISRLPSHSEIHVRTREQITPQITSQIALATSRICEHLHRRHPCKGIAVFDCLTCIFTEGSMRVSSEVLIEVMEIDWGKATSRHIFWDASVVKKLVFSPLHVVRASRVVCRQRRLRALGQYPEWHSVARLV